MPADFAMTVPVKMPRLHPKMPDNDWISDAKKLRPGLLVAHTLLPHSSDFSAVAMLNVSGKDQTLGLRHDTQIDIVTPCQTDYVSIAIDTEMTCVGARQRGADLIGTSIDTASCLDRRAILDGRLAVGHLDCQTVGDLICRAVPEAGPVTGQPSCQSAGSDGQSAGRDG